MSYIPTTASIGYVLTKSSGGSASSPADSQTYYLTEGLALASSLLASDARTRLYIPKAGTIKTAYGTITVGGTLGSGESIVVNIRLNDTTSTALTSSAVASSAVNNFSNSGLSIAVSAGDFIDIVVVTPAWVTNPTVTHATVSLYIE